MCAVQLLDLPNEMLLEIFKRLPRKKAIANIPRVCKKFRDLMNSASMWKSFGALDEFGSLKYTKQMFDSLFDNHGRYFKKLYFNGEFKFLLAQTSLDYVHRKLEVCRNLKVLDLTSNFSIDEIPFILSMPILESLYLEWCLELSSQSVTQTLCEENCPKLKLLSLRKCDQFLESHIMDIAVAQRKLEILDISYTQEIDVQCGTAICTILNQLKDFGFSANMQENSIEEWINFQNNFSNIWFF